MAGVGDDGVLSSIVSSVTGNRGADLFLEVGGLDSATQEHLDWVSQKPLNIGDEIRIKIIEAAAVDNAVSRRKIDSAKDLQSKKAYVRATAKKLGWTIQEDSEKGSS